MTTSLKYLGLIALFSIIFVSCNKDENEDSEASFGDAAIAKYLFDAAKDEVDQQLNFQNTLNGVKSDSDAGPRGGCASVTITPLGNTFPKNVTIVFPEGCTTYAGADIQGTVDISISGRVRENGTIATFTLTDFLYKKYRLSGKYTITFTGQNSHTTKVENGKILTPANRTITYSASNTTVQTEGLNTTFKTHPLTFHQDDVYSVVSVCEGVNGRGNNFTLTTTTPLQYKVACQWITEGSIIMTEDKRPKITATLDFGSGGCDNNSVLKINNFTKEIKLP